MKEILVRPNSVAFVDDDKFEYLNQFRWYLSKGGYALSGAAKLGIKSFTKMHRLVYGAEPGVILDHKDGNKLNNQLSNLRPATLEENVHNQRKRLGTKSKYKGVSFNAPLGLWMARCRMLKQDFFLGNYKTEEAAAYAYNKKASELSKFILLNDLPYNTEYLERILIEDRVTIIPAAKVSPYSFVYYINRKNGKQPPFWALRIKCGDRVFYKGGFKTDREAHEYLLEHHFEMVKGRPLTRVA